MMGLTLRCYVMALVLVLVVFPLTVLGRNTDLFNYGDETTAWEEGNDFGQANWDQVECDDVETCYGWPEKWQAAVGWKLKRNSCRDCRPGKNCANHHQSPVPLDRVLWGPKKQPNGGGLGPPRKDGRNTGCGDNHWMSYHDGTCTFEHMKKANSITVERHALRISQPIEKFNDTHYQLACDDDGLGNLFPKMDMSGGFSQWWFMNHIDIHTPSEHTQNGKRYAAEVQMGMFYSKPKGEDNGARIRMGTVGVFLDSKEEYEPYPQLDKLICEWRRYEQNVRTECGLDPVETHYPGCFAYHRPGMASPFRSQQGQRRRLNETEMPKLRRSSIDTDTSQEEQDAKLKMDPRNWREDDWTEEQWADFQEEYSRRHPLNATKQFDFGRHLCDYEHVPFDNWQFLRDCRTEYYFRYEGTSTYPPCFVEHNRWKVNVWRFMKDPIRIHPRQEKELQRLLKDRIAPMGSYGGSERECKSDTAAKLMEDGTAWVARDLQELDPSGYDEEGEDHGHDNFFCDCDDWGSKIPEEQEWCRHYRNHDEIRWKLNPYNTDTFTGF